MAQVNGPTVITSGLVFSLNAADKNSYPGSGTTWYDVSGNGNNGTLVNGPTYSDANQGSIVFDGVNDRVQTSYAPTFTDFTVCIWFKDNGSSAWGRLVDTSYINGFFISSYFATYGANYVGAGIIEPNPPHGIALAYEAGKPHFFVTTRAGTLQNIYLDGVTQTTSKTVSPNAISSTAIALGDWTGTNVQAFKGNINNCMIYNRALYPAEIMQNYLVQKSRFDY